MNHNQDPYWVIDHDFEIENADLTMIEWNANEIHLDGSKDIIDLLKCGLEIVIGWKEHLEQEFPLHKFDIVLSIDYGDEQVCPSVTIRFYAVRGQMHYVNPSIEELEKFDQPIFMVLVND